MRSNNNNPLTRDEILSRYFPQYRPAVAASQGLSGGSCIIAHDTHRVVLRRHHDPDAPPAHFLRHYRALSQLPASLAPRALFYTLGWMAVEYLHGVVNSALPDADELAALTVSFASTAAFWLAYCAIATIGAVLVVLRSGKAYAVLVAAAQTVAKKR